jgi:hypothetical protein
MSPKKNFHHCPPKILLAIRVAKALESVLTTVVPAVVASWEDRLVPHPPIVITDITPKTNQAAIRTFEIKLLITKLLNKGTTKNESTRFVKHDLSKG